MNMARETIRWKIPTILFLELVAVCITLFFDRITFLDLSLITVVLCSFFFSSENPDISRIFNRDTTATLRGLAMLGIMALHIHDGCRYRSPFLVNEAYLSVALFFFISGYGNQLSMCKKFQNSKIPSSWLRNKIVKIYAPFFVCYLVCFGMLYFMNTDKMPTVKETIKDLCLVSLPNQLTWFPKIILFCFLSHYLSHIVTSNRNKQTGILFGLIIAYILFAIARNWKPVWYKSVIAYPVGALVANQFDVIVHAFTSSHKLKILCGIVCLVFLCVYIPSTTIHILMIFCSLLFPILVFALTGILSFKTKFLSWIGNNSLEFYFFHIFSLQVFAFMATKNAVIYASLVVLLSVVCVYIYAYVKNLIFNKQPRRVGSSTTP